jgi:hypothetical protein
MFFKKPKWNVGVGGRSKPRIPKSLRNTIFSATILLWLLLVIGMAYIYIAGQKPTEDKIEAATPTTTTSNPIAKPVQPSPSARVGASIQSLTSPVSRGTNTSIYVRTNAGSTCKISVTYNNIASKDSGLVAKKADEYGSVSWTWTVEKTATPGKWPIKVTCAYNGRTAFVQGDLVVTI